MNICGDPPPVILYKYLPRYLGDGSSKTIPYFQTGCKLRFSQPGACNDIYECSPNLEGLTTNGIPKRDPTDEEFFRKIGMDHKSLEERNNILEKSYKQMESNVQWKIDTLNNHKKYLNERYHFFSLSERWNSPAMWGHYGGNHDGFVLGFDLTKFSNDYPDIGLLFHKVRYKKKRSKIKDIEPDYTSLLAVKITKSNEWRYEKEWRLSFFSHKENLLKLSNNTCSKGYDIMGFEIPLKYLSEVVIGHSADEELLNTIQSNLHNVDAYKAEPHFTSYLMDRKKVGL